MTWKSVPYGAYGVWAEAVDELGAVSEPASQIVTVAPTMPASQALLKIVSPNLGVTRPPLRFVAPATLVVTVDASVFARMELIGDGATVDAVVSPNGPGNTFVLTWRAVGAGTHAVAVRGTDELGRSRESEPFAMIVTAPDAPPASISMTTPVNGLVMDNGSDLPIAVDVSNPGGGTAQVTYLQDFRWLGFTAVAPHTFTARSLSYGLHRIEAQALDPTYGLVAKTVAYVDATASGAPVGVMTKPIQNAVYTATETITLAVDAVAMTQPIAKVDFYEGPNVIATVTTPPYSVD
jgi:hypothetical protein